MSHPAIPESPTARLLLELATQRASCEVSLGLRTLILVEGAVVDLRGTPDDCSLPAFLAAAGRIEEHERQVVEDRVRDLGLSVEQALAELPELEPEALTSTRRALLLDRLVRSFAALEHDDTSELPTPVPLRTAARGHAFDLVALVLDALARRAAFGAAEVVGELRRARFVWVDAPAQKRASSWAELGDIPHAMSIATLFPRHPAAPSRIAALVRAGLAQLDVPGASTAPLTKPSVRPTESTVVVGGESEPEPRQLATSTTPPAADSLDPGAPLAGEGPPSESPFAHLGSELPLPEQTEPIPSEPAQSPEPMRPSPRDS